jgi:hypothetical protein
MAGIAIIGAGIFATEGEDSHKKHKICSSC